MRFKSVIFDRDGVIIDSEPLNRDSALKAFQKQGIEITETEKKIIIGTHPVDYQDYFSKKYPGFDFPKFREYKRDLYLQGQKTAPLFANIINLIKKLNQQNIPTALVTSSTKKGTLDILRRAGLTDSFSVIITFEDCEQRKPAPDCYLIAAYKLGIKPEDCLVIEDSAVGLQAAKSAGMTCYVMPGSITADQNFSLADKILKGDYDFKNIEAMF